MAGVCMRVEKSNSVSFQSFKPDDKGKEFLCSLYNKTGQKARPVLIDELRKFKQTMSEYSQKMESKNIDIVLTTDPHNKLFWPVLQLKQGDKVLKDCTDAPSELFLFELDFARDDKKWTKSEVKKWFTRAKEEINGWFTLNYIDRFNNPPKSIETLIEEANKPNTEEQIINAIFG